MSKKTMSLEDMGYTKEEINVAKYGVSISVDPNYGYSKVTIGYEEICAIKSEMERLQNE